VFRGKVRANNGDLQLDCDQLVARCDKAQTPAQTNAVLGHGLALSALDAVGHVRITNLAGARYAFDEVTCPKGTFTVATGDLVLAGEVAVKSEKGPFKAREEFTIHVGKPDGPAGSEKKAPAPAP
jgi:hypothetical protein